MVRLRPIRPVVSIVFTALLLAVAPWSSHGALAATGTPNNQTLSMTVPDSGILTVSAENGTVSWTYPNPVDLGKLDFTNTLNNTSGWNVTAAMTDLVPSGFSGSCTGNSTNCLSYTNIQLTASSTFNVISGAIPTNLFRINILNPFAGTDDAAGTTLSTPKQVLTGGGTDKGSYSQGNGSLAGDNNLQPTAGLALESGTYGGTLQYTIMG
jgi:hypothetical protein